MGKIFAFVPTPNRHRRRIPLLTAIVVLLDLLGVLTVVVIVRREHDWVTAIFFIQLLLLFSFFWATVGQNMCGSGRFWLFGKAGRR
jgi:hypothetical protein